MRKFHSSVVILLYSVVLCALLTACKSRRYVLQGVEARRIEVTRALDAQPLPEAAAFIAPFMAGVDSLRRPYVGQSELYMAAARPESLLSNWVADALVVGTGGAARAAIVAAQKLGCRVSVTGRSEEKAQALATQSGCQTASWKALEALRPNLIIYTLPGGAPVPAGLNFAGSVVLEAEYKKPALSGFPCKAYIPGQRWLLWQAAAGYGLFTGEKPHMENLINAI